MKSWDENENRLTHGRSTWEKSNEKESEPGRVAFIGLERKKNNVQDMLIERASFCSYYVIPSKLRMVLCVCAWGGACVRA